jgi:hypothetical protein
MTVVLQSVLTCPHCGIATQETTPTDACLFFYECRLQVAAAPESR